jgi:hypothetical protein
MIFGMMPETKTCPGILQGKFFFFRRNARQVLSKRTDVANLASQDPALDDLTRLILDSHHA